MFQYVHTFFDFGNRQHRIFLFISQKNTYPPQIIQGPRGTGKTSIAAALVKEAQEQGLQVLWTVFTAQLAARARKQLGPGVTVDTCHAALGFDLDLAECRLNLAPYSLVIIDEFSQLEAKHLKHLVKLYDAVDRGIAIGLLGDRFQMGGFGEERIWHCREWTSHVHLTNLYHLYRCKDENFRKMLAVLRTSKPSDTEGKGKDMFTVARIMSNKRSAWTGHTPTLQDIKNLLWKYPHTTFMAVSRKGTNFRNALATQALFENCMSIKILAGDIESNPENYDEHGQMIPYSQLKPLQVTCYKGMNFFYPKCRQNSRFCERRQGHN